MKHWIVVGMAVAVALTTAVDVQAKRLGGGKSAGMQRSTPAQAAPQTPPPKPATPAQSAAPQAQSAQPAASPAAAAATAPAKRSWLGPIAGLAAGLGLAALMSHLGLGEAFANFLMLALLAVAVIFLVVFLMRRFGSSARPAALAGAGAGAAGAAPRLEPREDAVARFEDNRANATVPAFTPAASDVSVTGQPLAALGTTPIQVPSLPADFDVAAFERVAKMIFIRLQAANDAADLDDLRQFTTPEMFAALRLDLQDRSGAPQRTDVERVEAKVVEHAVESGRQIVSVRFQGLIREAPEAPAAAFDEVWHLVRPDHGDAPWAIAGIQQG